MKDKSVIKGWNHLPQHISKVSFDKIKEALQITAKAKEEELQPIENLSPISRQKLIEQTKQLQKINEKLNIALKIYTDKDYKSFLQFKSKIKQLQKENEEGGFILNEEIIRIERLLNHISFDGHSYMIKHLKITLENLKELKQKLKDK